MKRAIIHQTTLVIAVFTVFLWGCGTMVKFDVSVPKEIPVGSAGKIQQDKIRLDLEGLSLTVQFQNFRGGGAGPLEPLGIWLGIETRNGQFLLDPGLVLLTTDDKGAIRPMTFLGPANSWESPRAVGLGCRPRRYSLGWALSRVDVSVDDVKKGNPARGVFTPSVGPVTFQGKTCFMFFFDVDPSPDRSFTLSIRGISRGGKTIDIPDVLFQRGSVRKFLVA